MPPACFTNFHSSVWAGSAAKIGNAIPTIDNVIKARFM
jgi:hypothetical protein